MKKIYLSFVLMLCAMCAMATQYYYLTAVTKVTVEDQSYGTTYKYKLTLEQTCKNTSEYANKPTTTYATTATLMLAPTEHKLEGTYKVSDGTLKKDFSDITYNGNMRRPNPDKENTFVITKVDDTHYQIGEGVLNVQNMSGSNQYQYKYCYAASEIQTQGISVTPFTFEYDPDAKNKETFVDYDMTVTGVQATTGEDGYGNVRYFLNLTCTGKRLDNNVTYDYAVQLCVCPTDGKIANSYATKGSGNLLISTSSYVTWLKSDGSSKQRYLANDSISTLTIAKDGDKQYHFNAGTLICQDVSFSVMGEKHVDQTLYYHFKDNIAFGFDPDNKQIVILPNQVDVTEDGTEGINLFVKGNTQEGGIAYTVAISLEEQSTLAGTFTTNLNGHLSIWSKVSVGSTDSYIENGSTVMIVQNPDGTYSLSATLICENGYTYVISNYTFTCDDLNVITKINQVPAGNGVCNKKIEKGILYIRGANGWYSAAGK
ncbi:MAG: hypothetical protein MJZ65_03685 [Paludibacteraceae bacterium]|nr:hypothetical protein [Paludibacteraceae bacterium]